MVFKEIQLLQAIQNINIKKSLLLISLCSVSSFFLLSCSQSNEADKGELKSSALSSQEEKTPEGLDQEICEYIRTLLVTAEWDTYGVAIDDCGSVMSDSGNDVFILTFNDPAEWENLYAAMGDIPDEEVARYAFWRVPLGLLSLGFSGTSISPKEYEEMIIYFNNPKMTTYDVLPRDIDYVIDLPDSMSKEEFSAEVNKRVDEISLRVEVFNLADLSS